MAWSMGICEIFFESRSEIFIQFCEIVSRNSCYEYISISNKGKFFYYMKRVLSLHEYMVEERYEQYGRGRFHRPKRYHSTHPLRTGEILQDVFNQGCVSRFPFPRSILVSCLSFSITHGIIGHSGTQCLYVVNKYKKRSKYG